MGKRSKCQLGQRCWELESGFHAVVVILIFSHGSQSGTDGGG